MIISKKKFERLVEEEVSKRLIEVEEKRKEDARLAKMEEMVRLTDCQVMLLREEFDDLKRKLRNVDKRERPYA